LLLVPASGDRPATVLTGTQPDVDSDPTWSPDGKRIAFRHAANGRSDIFVVNVDGSGFRALTRTGDGHDPTWSPDGKQIAYKSAQNGDALWLMDADGRNRKLVLRVSAESWAPAWTR